MNNFSKYIKSYFFYTFSAFGISLAVISDVGLSSFNAMNLSVSEATDIKIGTITTIFNILFLLAYMISTKFEYKIKYLIQAFSVFIFGSLINFFTYNILGGITNLTYVQRLSFFLVGNLISGFSVGAITYYNAITFPIENLCSRLAEITKFSFAKYRYLIDIFSVITSLLISFSFSLPIYIREGTILSLLFFASVINFSKNFIQKFEEKNIPITK